MARMSNLLRRSGVYYARKVVPAHLREAVGRRELCVSLKTTDLPEAQRRAAVELVRFNSILSAAEKNPHDAAVTRLLREDAAWRNRWPRSEEEEEVEKIVIADALEEIATGERTENPAVVGALRRILARLNGTEKAPDASPTLSTLMAQWASERKPAPKTLQQWDVAKRRFIGLHGDLPVRQITKEMVRAFKTHLMAIPARNAAGRLTPGSIQKQLAALHSVLEYAVREGHLDANPGDRITIAGANNGRRLPYSWDDLKVIFGDSGKSKREGSRYWIPIVTLMGLRLSEILQLRPEDVREEDGTMVLHVRAGGGRSVKTASSERLVPIHPRLIELGFSPATAGKLLPWRPRFTSAQWSRWWRNHTTALGIVDPRKSFHSLRHSTADLLREANAPD